MPVQLNHTIVHARDKQRSARFLADLLGLADPTEYGPFLVVQVANDVSLDFMDDRGTIHPQHYAFLVTEDEFDQIFERITAAGLTYWADPSHGNRPGSTPMTVGAACTGRIRTGTTWKSSPGRTVGDFTFLPETAIVNAAAPLKRASSIEFARQSDEKARGPRVN